MTDPDALPTAVARPRGARLAWLLPIAALVATAWVGWRHWSHAGPSIVVTFENGHGLAPDAEVRYRGIAIGEVRDVELDAEQDVVRARIDLGPNADGFARAGARFWVVRPQIDLESGVRGAETLLGRRYISSRPGDGDPQHAFVGLEEPLVVDQSRAGDRHFVLEAKERGNLDAGTPITYRDVQVGVIVDVRLASDARSVEATTHVREEFAPLIRRGTKFYFEGGVAAEWGSRFLFMEFGGQLTRVLSGGGVALAIPPDPGPTAADGHRFEVHSHPEEEWEEWNPSIPLFGSREVAAPAPAAPPEPLAARLTWREGIFKSKHTHEGWILPTRRGLLGPLRLLRAPPDAAPGTAALSVDGTPVSLRLPPRVRGDGVGLLEAEFEGPSIALDTWDGEEPADCLAVRGGGEPPLALLARHLRPTSVGFDVAKGVVPEGTWDGAVVMTREGLKFVGVLSIGSTGARVVRLEPIDPPIEPPVESSAESPIEAADGPESG